MRSQCNYRDRTFIFCPKHSDGIKETLLHLHDCLIAMLRYQGSNLVQLDLTVSVSTSRLYSQIY